MKKLRKHKWLLNWLALSIFCLDFILFAITFEDKPWIGNVLQTIGTTIGIYLTLIIFFFSKEDSDKQFANQLEHLQNLTAKQIEALQLSTEKHIEALHKATSEEIIAFEKQTNDIVTKLTDNSVLLGEILNRSLESELNNINNIIAHEQKSYSKLNDFALFRTPEEKANQLDQQKTRLQQFQNYKNYIEQKYKQIKLFLSQATH
jgi:hypothetical protein